MPSPETITNSTARFEGDFGSFDIIPSQWIGGTRAGDVFTADVDRGYLLNLDDLELCYNNMPQVKSHPDLGGGERIEAWTLFGLKLMTPIKHGKLLPP